MIIMVKNNPYIWIYVTLRLENFESLKFFYQFVIFLICPEKPLPTRPCPEVK